MKFKDKMLSLSSAALVLGFFTNSSIQCLVFACIGAVSDEV